MITKLLFLTLFFVGQGAQHEPWWIQMFFPNVSFTGKYHPSNYKVGKSPLLPDSVQNPNDVWSPAYWMPYKLAYSQYWIDLIDNTTKAEQELIKESQAQPAETSPGYQTDQYSHPEQSLLIGQNSQCEQRESNAESLEQTFVIEANYLAQQVQTQQENMKQDIKQILSEAKKEAEKQMHAIMEETEEKKQEVAIEAEYISRQAEEVSAQIDQAAKAKAEAIAQEATQFEIGIKKQFAILNGEAKEIVLEADKIAEEIKHHQFQRFN